MTSYLQSTRDFLYRRRRPFIVAGTLIGGVYVVANYAVTKISEMQRRMVEEKRDKENLKRRFAQNQEDCTFTIQALLPTLGDQLSAYMDVDDLTAKLQRGRQASSGTQTPTVQANGVKQKIEGETVAEHVVNGSETEHAKEESPKEEESSSAQQSEPIINGDKEIQRDTPISNGIHHPKETNGITANGQEHPQNDALEEAWNKAVPKPNLSGLEAVAEPSPKPIAAEARLTPSPSTASELKSAETNGSQPSSSTVSESIIESSSAPANSSTTEEVSVPTSKSSASFDSPKILLREKKAKLALWNELKIVSISRAITAIYGVVLLSLQTHVQLNLLGRYAYLTSVSSLSASFDSSNHHIRLERNDGQVDLEDELVEDQNEERVQSGGANSDVLTNGIDVQTERLYLTLSWWFLHKGWQELADIVRDAVEEVFGGIALKEQLSHAEFMALIRKVRRRIEYESRSTDGQSTLGASFASMDVRSEYSEATTTMTNAQRRGKRRNFSGILFPPSGQEIDVLIEAGALPRSSKVGAAGGKLETLSSTLPALLDETRDIVESSDFWRVMRLGLRESFFVFEQNLRPSFGLDPISEKEEEKPLPEASIMELPASSIINGDLQSSTIFSNQEGKSIRLASLFPIVARQSTQAIQGIPNEYVESIENVKELRAFCAVIYSAWS